MCFGFVLYAVNNKVLCTNNSLGQMANDMDKLLIGEEQRLQFIELVKDRPVLYDKKHRLWRSVKEKEWNWNEIAATISTTDTACKRTWKTMREQYNRYLKMPKNKRKKFRYMAELSFLGGTTDNSNDISDYSDFSDYSEPKPRKRKATSKTYKHSKRKSKNCHDDEETVETPPVEETDHEEYIYDKDVLDADKSEENFASELFSTFNTMLNNRFELNEDDNDIFLRMLSKKMKCLPNTVKNRLQEGFLEQVNYETLQCLHK